MKTGTLLAGAGLGAALAFILDPDRGRRRRALMRDQMARMSRVTREGLDATGRDMANRARGLTAEARARLKHEDVEDQKLIARVRSKLGRACSHPHAVEVKAYDGHISLRGPILAHEVDTVLSTVEAVPGVKSVSSELEPHEHADDVPALQGGEPATGPAIDLLQRRWSPTTRALVVGGAIATGAYLAASVRR